MPLPTDEEVQRFHRYFAVECNNKAWGLAELADRTTEQREEMVSLAEVAAWHWSKVGTTLNSARADMLLGWVCFVVGRHDDASGYTERVRAKLRDEPEGIGAWDGAFLALLEAREHLTNGDQPGIDAASTELDIVRESLDQAERDAFDHYRESITA